MILESKKAHVPSLELRLLRTQLEERIQTLSESDAKIVLQFVDEIVRCYDPDVVQNFVQWRSDPRLLSLLQIGAALSDDLRDQLLFLAEDLFISETK